MLLAHHHFWSNLSHFQRRAWKTQSALSEVARSFGIGREHWRYTTQLSLLSQLLRLPCNDRPPCECPQLLSFLLILHILLTLRISTHSVHEIVIIEIQSLHIWVCSMLRDLTYSEGTSSKYSTLSRPLSFSFDCFSLSSFLRRDSSSRSNF